MIKIIDVVENIIRKDEEAVTAAVKGYLNYTSYANIIKKEVEKVATKKVTIASLVVAISRIVKSLEKANPLIKEIKINNVITKSPLTEMVYEKSKDNLSQIIKIYEKLKIDQSEFFTLTLSENEITIICSDRIAMEIQKRLDTNNRTSDKEIPSSTKPVMMVTGLASISLTLDPKYYEMSNITYSLLRRIASKHIPLAETITTHTEIIFVFKQEYLSEMVMLFVK